MVSARRSVKKTAAAWAVGIAATVLLGLALPGRAAATVAGTPEALPGWTTSSPGGIEIDPATASFHVISQSNDRVEVYDATGSLLRSYGSGVLFGPSRLAITDDLVYVTDSTTHRVEYFDGTSGTHVGGWGGLGLGAGEFDEPSGIVVHDAEVYVADFNNDRVQVFTPAGVWVREITGAGTAYALSGASGVAAYDDELYVVSAALDEIVVFDPTTGSGHRTISTDAGSSPRGIDITADGDLFVSTLSDQMIKVYTTGGASQTAFATAEISLDLVVDPSGDTVWTTEFLSDRVVPYTWLLCTIRVPTIVGTSFDDTFTTGAADDIVVLGPGADDVRLGDGMDLACGGGGPDIIRGEADMDVLYGGPGADLLLGGSSADLIQGEAGADDLRGGGGGDTILGGDGPDNIIGQGGGDSLQGGGGSDTIDGQGSGDTITGGPGNDVLSGQNGADLLNGGGGQDTLRGQTGPDDLFGGEGADELIGGNGADTLYGGPGFDRCSGNTGPDSAEAATCEQTPGVETLF